jgi:hypothetical protein
MVVAIETLHMGCLNHLLGHGSTFSCGHMLIIGLPFFSKNLEHMIACMYYGLSKHIKVGYLIFFYNLAST